VWLNAVIRALIAFTDAMRAKIRDDDLVMRLWGRGILRAVAEDRRSGGRTGGGTHSRAVR
jgi:hypothetical protein